MEKLRIGCVVMAAGNGSRFGRNKLAAEVDGKTLLRRALEAVPANRLCRVAVVTQYPEAAEAARRFSFTPVENHHPDWGISHTISLGLDALGDCDAALFLVSDQPLLERASVEGLLDLYCRHPACIAALGHIGVRGNPCCSPPASFRSCGRCKATAAAAPSSAAMRTPCCCTRYPPVSSPTWTPATP